MHAWVLFFPFLGLLVTSDPLHLKHGALTARLGQVTLIEDVLMVRYPLTALVSIPVGLQDVSRELSNVKSRLHSAIEDETRLYSASSHTVLLLNYLSTRVNSLHAELNTTVHDYNLHPVHARTKRGLVDGFGKISQYFIGTAMDVDVQDLRRHYNELIAIATTNRQIVTLNFKKVAQLESNVNELLQQVNNLTTSFNEALKRLDMLTSYLVTDQFLHIIETSLNTVVSMNEEIIAYMVDAANGRTTTSLFPVEDLLHTIDIGISNYTLQPLYTGDVIQYYYPLLETILTMDAIIVFVPFKSLDTFEAYQVEPFPFRVNHSIMILDSTSSLVLVASDFSLYSIGDMNDLKLCKSSYLHQYHCSASLFAFLPIAGGVCEAVLTRTNASDALSLCPYKHLVPKPMFHRNFHGYHYFYFQESFYISVICPEGTTYVKVLGHYAVQSACYVRSSRLTTFPSRFYLAFTANLTSRIFPVTSLRNITSKVSFVTNSLSTLSFTNKTEFIDALEDALPVYLSPYVLFPSLLLPFLFLVVILFCLYCCIRKAMTLYTYLEGIRQAPEQNRSGT